MLKPPLFKIFSASFSIWKIVFLANVPNSSRTDSSEPFIIYASPPPLLKVKKKPKAPQKVALPSAGPRANGAISGSKDPLWIFGYSYITRTIAHRKHYFAFSSKLLFPNTYEGRSRAGVREPPRARRWATPLDTPCPVSDTQVPSGVAGMKPGRSKPYSPLPAHSMAHHTFRRLLGRSMVREGFFCLYTESPGVFDSSAFSRARPPSINEWCVLP